MPGVTGLTEPASNENYPYATVLELRRLGHDVLTSVGAGQANQRIPDDRVVALPRLRGGRC